MRKLILGVSLYWPLILTIAATGVSFVTLGSIEKWGGLIAQIPFWVGCALWAHVWLPFYRSSKFGIAMRDEIQKTYIKAAEHHGDPYSQMSLSERIYDKLCRLS